MGTELLSFERGGSAIITKHELPSHIEVELNTFSIERKGVYRYSQQTGLTLSRMWHSRGGRVTSLRG